ncbi:MAG TPA: ATP-binding protein [Gaiellales bacterium]
MSPTREGRRGSGNIAESERSLLIVRRTDGATVHVSDSFCRLMGRSREEMLGRRVTAYGMARVDRLDWVMERLPAVGQGYRYETEIVTASGPLRIGVELQAAVIGGESVIVSSMAAVDAPEAAGDAGVLGLVLDGAPVGLIVYDRDLRIIRVNQRVEQMGRVKSKHIGQRLEEVVPNANPIVVGAIRQVFATREEMTNIEVSTPDGVSSYLVSVFPIGFGAEPTLVGQVFLDVTDRVLAERALAASEIRRRKILGDLLQAQEDERSRIATELHDDTVQVMTAAMLSMDRLVQVSRKGDFARVESAVAHARAVLEEATDRTRRLMFELRPAILHDRGLGAALGLLADQTARETDATTYVAVHERRYDPVVEALVYRTVQEALANVRKHADAHRITIRLDDDKATLTGEVRDDGRGFDPSSTRRRSDAALHLGLETMVERVRAAGGDVNITTAPTKGTTVAFSLPLIGNRLRG